MESSPWLNRWRWFSVRTPSEEMETIFCWKRDSPVCSTALPETSGHYLRDCEDYGILLYIVAPMNCTEEIWMSAWWLDPPCSSSIWRGEHNNNYCKPRWSWRHLAATLSTEYSHQWQLTAHPPAPNCSSESFSWISSSLQPSVAGFVHMPKLTIVGRSDLAVVTVARILL